MGDGSTFVTIVMPQPRVLSDAATYSRATGTAIKPGPGAVTMHRSPVKGGQLPDSDRIAKRPRLEGTVRPQA